MANADNLETQKQLNELLTERKRLVQDTTRLFRQQVQVANDLVNALGEAQLSADIPRTAQNAATSLKQAAESAKEFSDQQKDLIGSINESMEEQDDGFQSLFESYKQGTEETSAWGAASAGFIDGMTKGFTILSHGLQGMVSLAATAVQGIFGIGKAILSIPFKIFNAFVAEANRGGGGVELWKAYENVRKTFGDFHSDMAKNVIKSARSMRGELAETGLSTFRVTGFLWDRLNAIRELATEMGATFNVFGEHIAENAERMVAYQKGLGLANEQMKSMAQLTQGTGDTFEETLRTVTNFSTSLGKQFGMSQKVIARDVGIMSQDLKKFGSVGVREMAQLSVYTRKLGVDFKDLLGIVDKFDNFEDAADSAARLAQAFGVNIDAMAMIKEQDPGKRFDMLRKQFFAAGKDISKLTRQERNYLASTTGIEDQALNAAFALENQGKSYDEVAQAGQTAEQQQLTQAEAMQKLASSIERVVLQGNRVGGFFDRFVMGLRRGIRWNKDFWRVMRNIRRSLWATEIAGRKVGRAFIQMFPGMKQFIRGVGDFFSPDKFRNMADKVVRGFKKFFKELGDPATAKQAFGNLLKSLKETFFGMVDMENSAMGKIVGGIKKSMKAVGQIVLSGMKIAMEKIRDFLKAITKVVSGETDFGTALKEMFDDAGQEGANLFSDIWFEISKQLGPVAKELWGSMKKLFTIVLTKVKTMLVKWWKEIKWMDIITSKAGLTIASILFGPAFLKGAMAGLGQVMIKMGTQKAVVGGIMSLGGKLAGFFGQEVFSFGGTSKIGGWVRSLGSKIAAPFSKLGEKLGGTMGSMMSSGIANKLAAGGAVIAAAVAGWNIGKMIDEEWDVSDVLSGYAEDVDNVFKDFNAGSQMVKTNMQMAAARAQNEDLKQALLTGGMEGIQNINKVLEENLNLSKQDRELAVEAIANRQKALDLDLKGLFVEKSVDSLGRSNVQWIKDAHGQQKLSQENEMKFQIWKNKQLDSRGISLDAEAAALHEQIKGERELLELQKAGGPPRSAGEQIVESIRSDVKSDQESFDISEDGLDYYDKVKKLDSKKVEKIIENFRGTIKPLLIGESGDGGLKKDLIDIGKAFSDKEIGEGIVAMRSINMFGQAASGLTELVKIGKITPESIEKSMATIRASVSVLTDPQLISGFSSIDKNKESVDKGITNITQMGEAVSGIRLFHDEINNLNNRAMKTGLHKTENVRKLPAVDAVIKMVDAHNAIAESFSRLKPGELAPKLENLGRSLGLFGKDKISLSNQKLNVDVYVDVLIDSDDLISVIKEKKTFMESTKPPKTTK